MVVGFGIGWLVLFAQCVGEVVQAGGLVVFCSGDVLVEGECLAVVGFGLGWFALSSPGFCVGLFRPLSFVLLCVCFLLVAV